MTEHHDRVKLYEDLALRLAAAVRAVQLYSGDHPIITRSLTAAEEALTSVHAHQATAVLGIVGGNLIGGEMPLPRATQSLQDFVARLQRQGVERLAFDRGVTRDELVKFLQLLTARSTDSDSAGPGELSAIALPHIRAGHLLIDRAGGSDDVGVANVRRAYGDAAGAAEMVWESAQTEDQPDLRVAHDTIDGLVDGLMQNRTAMLGLTAMKHYDNYTFTHMVNVSILTMGQARALGIEGRLLRDFGMAGLMHDIGKVRTPPEILNKPDKLTDAEFAIMKRHVVDGAEILRRTPEMPALAAVVAFEHHLRADGTGYPDRVRRTTLNLGTVLCGIADVYDAMRSKRAYQQSFPTERILAVYRGNEGARFDQHLIRRFVQLLGIYPPGTLVRLSNNQAAIVLRPHGPDPFRPAVRILFEADRTRSHPYETNLWESGAGYEDVTVTSTLDPAEFQIDPLSFL